MRTEVTLAGEKLVWESGRKTQMRAEIALAMPWSEIAANVSISTAIQQQCFYSGFSYPDGRAVPEDEVDRLFGADPDGFKALLTTVAAQYGVETPLEEAPLPTSSGSGAPSA